MTDIAVDTLRLRGPHARRLAAVAARTLPAALERALADVGDVRLDRVEVMLDLDPSEYDDETLAILWADAIRARMLAAVPGHRPRAVSTVVGESAVSTVSTGGPGGTSSVVEVVAALREWSLGAGSVSAAVLPSVVLALGDPAVARVVRAEVGREEWAELLAVLGKALRIKANLAAESPVTPSVEVERPTGDVPARRASAVPPRAEGTPQDGESVVAQRELVLDRLAVLGELVAAPTGLAGVAVPSAGVDLAIVTRAAGLALLYPWLADHCRRAEALHPWLDVLDVREAALAVIVDPEDPTLADDPLVGLLAGRAETPAESRERIELAHFDDVVESAARVLASFAAMLPGFGGSTELFVRDSWIRRLGVVHRDRDPALLVAATHPLDVLLPMLPYPIGLVKLPWSAPLSVRFAP